MPRTFGDSTFESGVSTRMRCTTFEKQHGTVGPGAFTILV